MCVLGIQETVFRINHSAKFFKLILCLYNKKSAWITFISKKKNEYEVWIYQILRNIVNSYTYMYCKKYEWKIKNEFVWCAHFKEEMFYINLI